jgi:hypothetical protein
VLKAAPAARLEVDQL